MKNKILSVLPLLLLIQGCVSIQTLPDGQRTAMPSNSLTGRQNTSVTATPTTGILQYQTGLKCEYKEIKKLPSDSSDRITGFSFTSTPIDERSHIVIKYTNDNINTAMIGKTGKLYDFNLLDDQTGERVSSEIYKDYLERTSDWKTAQSGLPKGRTNYVNPVSIILPEFKNQARVIPGTGVSDIRLSNGDLWGQYVYRGTGNYNGKPVYALDLTRAIPGLSGPPLLVGYSFIDQSSSLPVYLAFDSGTKVILEQISCES